MSFAPSQKASTKRIKDIKKGWFRYRSFAKIINKMAVELKISIQR